MTKHRIQLYRHPPYNGHCCGPWNFIMVVQDCSKQAIHKCYYCGQTTIPTAYYSTSEKDAHGKETRKYFILDREISKEEFEHYEKLDNSISEQARKMQDKIYGLELKNARLKALKKKNKSKK